MVALQTWTGTIGYHLIFSKVFIFKLKAFLEFIFVYSSAEQEGGGSFDIFASTMCIGYIFYNWIYDTLTKSKRSTQILSTVTSIVIIPIRLSAL